jgi:5'(3')-deoxyribonucleotidase
MKKRIYIDMDGVLCNYMKRFIERVQANPKNKHPQLEFDFFRKLEEMPGAIEAFKALAKEYDVWILTRPSYKNPMCYTEKRLWVEDHLGFNWCRKLIIAPDKSLMIGDYLIDDMPWPKFQGEQLLFGSNECPDWDAVLDKLL